MMNNKTTSSLKISIIHSFIQSVSQSVVLAKWHLHWAVGGASKQQAGHKAPDHRTMRPDSTLSRDNHQSSARPTRPPAECLHTLICITINALYVRTGARRIIEVEDRALYSHKIESNPNLQPWPAFLPPLPLPSPPPLRRSPPPLSALLLRLLFRSPWKRRLVCKRRSDFSSEF